ncbi:MAG: DUF433 domain-containing protein [Phormidesmis sp.]
MQKLKYLDTRSLPAYSFVEAARYLRIPVDTLRTWVRGRSYPTAQGVRFSKPLIELTGIEAKELSFINLVEAHVLRAIRVEHSVPLEQIRIALSFIQSELGVTHPLSQKNLLKTDGKSIYVEHLERLLDASKGGQIAIRETLEIYLTRIEADEAGIAVRLFPFIHPDEKDDQRLIVIDPAISFGRPVIAGTGIPTRVLAELHQAGDSIEDLALDYDCERSLVQGAIEYENTAA